MYYYADGFVITEIVKSKYGPECVRRWIRYWRKQGHVIQFAYFPNRGLPLEKRELEAIYM